MSELITAIVLEAGFARYLRSMGGRARVEARWNGPRERAWYIRRMAFRRQWGIG